MATEKENKDKEEKLEDEKTDLSWLLDQPKEVEHSEEDKKLLGIDPEADPNERLLQGNSVPETIRLAENKENILSPTEKNEEEENDKKGSEDEKESSKSESTPEDESETEVDDKKKSKLKVQVKEKPKEKPSTEEPITVNDDKKSEPKADEKVEDTPTFDLTEEDLLFIDQLDEETVAELDFWKFAELNDPDKYKGSLRKKIQFLKENQKKVEHFESEDPDTPIEENEAYQKWYNKHNPQINPAEARRLNREQVIQEAEKRVEKKYQDKLNSQDGEIQKLKNAPVMQEQHSVFLSQLSQSFPDEIVEVYESTEGDGAAKQAAVAEKFPEELRISERNYNEALIIGQEYEQIVYNGKKADMNNPLHKEIDRKIRQIGENMTNPDNKINQVRDGKTFVKLEDFVRMTAEQRDKHWTVDAPFFLDVIAQEAKCNTKLDIEDHRNAISELEKKILAKHGIDPDKIEKKEKSQEKVSESADEEAESPGATVSRSGGASNSKSSGSSSPLSDMFTKPLETN